jgi:FMN reductase
LDLIDLGPALLDWGDPSVAQAVADVIAADLVVVASPTYKATYTGLLKLFLDRFSAGSLASVTAVPLMLGGDLRHSLAPEAFLKPVLAELGASSPTRGLFLLDVDADAEWAEALSSWLAVARTQLPAHLLDPAGSA